MILIIGAGPAGLATAYYLHKFNIPYLVLEKQQIGQSWRSHYDSLHLHTLKQLSALPGLDYPAAVPAFPSKDDVVAHLEAYVAHYKLNVRTGVTVQKVRWDGEWIVSTNEEQFSAETLVCTTGIWSNPYLPELPNQAQFGGDICHANDYKNPDAFAGRRVLVVGAGNTAADIAVELAEANIPTGVVIRSGAAFVPYPNSVLAMQGAAWLFRTLPPHVSNRLLTRPEFTDIGIANHPKPPVEAYPVVGFKLPDAIRSGQVILHGNIQTLAPQQVHFEDGSLANYDTIILATGYRPNLDFIPRTQLGFRDNGWPIVCQSFRSLMNRQLYCVGYNYPATSGWIQNMRRETKIATRMMRKIHRKNHPS